MFTNTYKKIAKIICVDIATGMIICYIFGILGLTLNIISLIEGFFYGKIVFQDILIYVVYKMNKNYEFLKELGLKINDEHELKLDEQPMLEKVETNLA